MSYIFYVCFWWFYMLAFYMHHLSVDLASSSSAQFLIGNLTQLKLIASVIAFYFYGSLTELCYYQVTYYFECFMLTLN